MRRVALIVFAVIAPLLGGGLGAAWAFRVELARLAIDEGLTRAGFEGAAYRIDSLELSHARVSAIDLGGATAVEAISLDYDLSRPWAPRLGEILVTGPRIDLGAPALARLLAAGGGGGFDPGPLSLRVRDGEIRWESPLGPLRIALDGQVRRHDDGTIQGTVDLVARAEDGQVEASANLTATPGGDIVGAARLAGGFLAFERARVDGLAGEIGFSVEGGALATLRAELAELALTLDGTRVARGALSLSRRGNIVVASLEGRAFGASGRIEATGIPNFEAGLVRLRRLAFDGLAPHDAALWRHAGDWAPTAGEIAISMVGHDLSLDLAALAAAPALALPAVLADGALSTVVDIRGAALPNLASDISGVASLDFSAPAGEVEASLAVPALFTLGDIDRGLLVSHGLAETLGDGGARLSIVPAPALRLFPARDATGEISGLRVAGGARISLDLADRLTIKATTDLDGTVGPDGYSGRVSAAPMTAALGEIEFQGHRARRLVFAGAAAFEDGTLEAGGRLEGEFSPRLDALAGLGWIKAKLPLKARLAGGRLTLSLDGVGDVRLPPLGLNPDLSLPSPLAVKLEAGVAPLLRFDTASGRHQVDVRIRPVPFQLHLAGEDAPMVLALAPGVVEIALDGMTSRIALADGHLTLPGEGLHLRGIQAEVTNLAEASFRVGQVQWLDAPVSPPRLLAVGRARIGADDLGVGLSVLDESHRLRFDATIHYRFAEAALDAEITMPPLTFAPDGMQPGEILPELAVLKAVAGQISGQARLQLRAGEVTGTAAIEARGLGFSSQAATVGGLDARIELSQLWPPRTGTPQRVTIDALVAGVEASAISADLSLAGDATRPLIAKVTNARSETSFARVDLDPLIFDPDATVHELTIRLSEVDLAKLLQRLEVDGVSGTGRLSGVLPVRLLETGFAVTGGRLAAEGPGVIRISVAALNQALAGTAEQVKLLLDALEDFRYSRLVLGLEKPPDGRGTLTLSIEGRNPAVLDGQPFVVNVDLGGKFDQLLDTALEAYRLSDRAFRATVQ